jgi:drug/metabolite transporter (DMT)-like permease
VSRLRDPALFVGLALCWGVTFPAVEVGLTAVEPVVLGALRFDVGALVALAYVLATGGARPRSRADFAAVAVGGTLLVAVNVGFLFVGQVFTTGGIAAIVYSLNPILTTAFAAVLFGGEALDARGALGVVAGLVGVALVANPSPADLAGPTTVGVGLVLVAAVSVSLGSVLLREFDPGAPALSRMAWSMALGALELHLVAAVVGQPVPVVAELPLDVLGALAFLGVFASAVAYGIYFTLIERVGPFEANLVSYVVPVIATVLGAVYLDEPVTVATVAGFALVVVGFALVKRRAIRREVDRLRDAGAEAA